MTKGLGTVGHLMKEAGQSTKEPSHITRKASPIFSSWSVSLGAHRGMVHFLFVLSLSTGIQMKRNVKPMAFRDQAQAYIDDHWDEVLADIQALVSIESVRDEDTSGPGAPYGAGPCAALEKVLQIASDYGLEVHNCEGYIGYVDLPGVSDTQIGIIGHVDVVPAGPDWDYDPYALTRKEGYLLGRGVMDDKGPLVIALHVLRFLKEQGIDQGTELPYTIRLLIGACEETTMEDVDYYRGRYADPAFLFSPDGQFPVVYGEAGIAHGKLMSAPCVDGDIIAPAGGQATNAVPGVATAVVRVRSGAGSARLAPGTYGSITVEACTASEASALAERAEGIVEHVFGTADEQSFLKVTATGISAHASLPHLGENAIGLLADFLLDQGIGTPEEREFLELIQSVCHNPDGSTFGVDSNDEHFGDLSVVATLLAKEGDTLVQWLDFRYPTVITALQIEKCVGTIAFAFGANFVMTHDAAPFVMEPSSSQVRALLDAYSEITGAEAFATTSKGGTYARLFPHAVCFGPEKTDQSHPSWVGGLHSANEGASEDLLKESLVIYALALSNLMDCSF